MHQVFSIEESLKFGWEKTKAHSMILFQALLTLFAYEIVASSINHAFKHSAGSGLAWLIVAIVGAFLSAGFIVITLKIARGERAVYKDIIPPVRLVWDMTIASLLTGLLVLGGLILLVIPGIYIAIRLSVVRYAVVDGASITESLRKSSALTKGDMWQLFLFFLAFIVINIIGALLFIVGLLVTIPATMIAMAHMYDKLKAHHANHAHEHEQHEGHEHSHTENA